MSCCGGRGGGQLFFPSRRRGRFDFKGLEATHQGHELAVASAGRAAALALTESGTTSGCGRGRGRVPAASSSCCGGRGGGQLFFPSRRRGRFDFKGLEATHQGLVGGGIPPSIKRIERVLLPPPPRVHAARLFLLLPQLPDDDGNPAGDASGVCKEVVPVPPSEGEGAHVDVVP
jgi:hypothetical protein